MLSFRTPKAGDTALFLCCSCGRSFSAKIEPVLPAYLRLIDSGTNPRCPHCRSKKHCGFFDELALI